MALRIMALPRSREGRGGRQILERRTRVSASLWQHHPLLAFSISETSSDPTTACVGQPAKNETWAGQRVPKPTAMGSRDLRVRG